MKINRLATAVIMALTGSSCSNLADNTTEIKSTTSSSAASFKWRADRFADIQMLRYQIPKFETLTVKRKELLYYLAQAALAGRDIIWDQNYKYNLTIRHTLEAIVKDYSGDRTTADFEKFIEYTKRVWFSNGIHHHYMNGKILPTFSQQSFNEYVLNVAPKGHLPLTNVETPAALLTLLNSVMFDPSVAAKKVDQSANTDNVKASAINFYEGVTEQEVVDFYASKMDKNDKTPVSWGLNSKLVKIDGKVTELPWKVGGMYGEALSKVVYWFERAITVAENEQQAKTFASLVKYFKSGDLKDFDAYNIQWVKDTESSVDVVNGFIEVYNDPLAARGSFESVVSFKDPIATKVIAAIAKEAQWFEDNSPLFDAHKKKTVKGITGKAITVVMESGDASPSTPIGINLPNANWIRANHGSKSVSLSNIVAAHDNSKGGALKEFAWDEAEYNRGKKYGPLSSILHTDMHEVIGHASGQINEGVGTPKETLKQYSSALEEGRADLVALYYLMDQKLVDMGIMPSLEVGKAAYDKYIRNGMLLQLRRLVPGQEIEEAHMRNRQLVASWVYEKGLSDNVIEKRVRDNKTYCVINDYIKLQSLFGDLLRELQRIKSEGDFKAGQHLIEHYAVKVDPILHAEAIERYKKLELAPYSGFINPKLVPVYQGDKIIDVKVEYPSDFSQQMLEYGREHAFLPVIN